MPIAHLISVYIIYIYIKFVFLSCKLKKIKNKIKQIRARKIYAKQ